MVFTRIKNDIHKGVESAMTETGEDVCEQMKSNLQADGHSGTGELLESIGFNVTEEDGRISVDIHIADYGKFIEHGTGAAHGVADGRQGSWRYKDRNGNWHTTDGMDADPFIEPAVEDMKSRISAIIGECITSAVAKATKGGSHNG